MLTYKTLYEAEFGKLVAAAQSANAVGTEFTGAAGQMQSHATKLPGMWEGKDGEAATTLLKSQKTPLEDAGEVFRKTSRVVQSLGTDLQTQQNHFRGTVADAEARIPGKVNLADGSVTPDPIQGATFNSAADVAAYNKEKKRREDLAKQYADELRKQLEAARKIDAGAKGKLASLDQFKEAAAADKVDPSYGGPGLIKKPEWGAVWRNGKWEPTQFPMNGTDKFEPKHFRTWAKDPRTGRFVPLKDSAGNDVPSFRDPNTGEIIPALIDNRTGRLVTDRQGNPIQVIRDPNYRGDPANAHYIPANPDEDPRRSNKQPVKPTVKLHEVGDDHEHVWWGDPKGGQSPFLGGDVKHKTTLVSNLNYGAGAEASDGNARAKAEIAANAIKFGTEAEYTNGPFKAKGTGEALIGANAELEGSIGRDGVNAKAGAFAGGKVKVGGTAEFAGVGAGAEAEGWAGIGAEGELNLGKTQDGKWRIGGKLGLGLGLGGKVGGNITIDPKAIAKFANPFD